MKNSCNRRVCGSLALALALVLPLTGTPSAEAGDYTILFNFDWWNGSGPQGGLVLDFAGNLYGTTGSGGASGLNYGVVFKLDSTGKETVLYNFAGGPSDGSVPQGGLVRDFAGNLYGTTMSGGSSGQGVVFKLDSTGKETVLHSFAGGPDGYDPEGGLVRDFTGNLYGSTAGSFSLGGGVVFKLDATGKETVLHEFAHSGRWGGGIPNGDLVRDFAGNLYGTTTSGGASNYGVVFKLDWTGKETVLHSFAGGPSDGSNPQAGLVRDFAGNLYGTTMYGGTFGGGVVFKLDSTGKETVLHNFAGGPADGYSPGGVLVLDFAGNLYGTTLSGGITTPYGPPEGNGVVFKLDSTGKETVLHSFAGEPADGLNPGGGLVLDFAGNLYGTTGSGGANLFGVVFKLQP